jgi:hypothetical protein
MHTPCPTHSHCSPRLHPLNFNYVLLLQDSLPSPFHPSTNPRSTHTHCSPRNQTKPNSRSLLRQMVTGRCQDVAFLWHCDPWMILWCLVWRALLGVKRMTWEASTPIQAWGKLCQFGSRHLMGSGWILCHTVRREPATWLAPSVVWSLDS